MNGWNVRPADILLQWQGMKFDKHLEVLVLMKLIILLQSKARLLSCARSTVLQVLITKC